MKFKVVILILLLILAGCSAEDAMTDMDEGKVSLSIEEPPTEEQPKMLDEGSETNDEIS